MKIKRSKSLQNIFLSIFENIEVDKIQKALYDDHSFYDYICFNLDNVFWDCFEEYTNVAVDEDLDKYLDKANEDARDKLYELSSEASNVASLVLESLQSITLQLLNIIDILNNASESVNSSIDNT